MSDIKLPPLPKPFDMQYDDIDRTIVNCYSTQQVETYARAAVLADRAARAEQEDWLTLICKHAAFNAGKEGAAPEELPEIVADLHQQAATVQLGDVTYEIWQDDMMVASSTCPKDASHYAAVYSQDGEVKVYTVIRRDWDGPSIPAAPTRERGADDEGG